MVHDPGPFRAAGDVGPLLGPHADRPQHRPAAAAAAAAGRGRAGDGRRPRDARPRRRSGGRRRRPAARRRHVDPPRRPRGLLALPRQRALQRLLADAYKEPERTVVASEILHAIIGHRRRGEPYTLEAGVVRVADALDMAQGRTRLPLESGHEGIHSISAAAVDEVRISAGEERPVKIEIQLNNSAGIFQVDDLLATKIRDTPLEGQVEVVAKVEGETEKRLLSGFRLLPSMADAATPQLVIFDCDGVWSTHDLEPGPRRGDHAAGRRRPARRPAPAPGARSRRGSPAPPPATGPSGPAGPSRGSACRGCRGTRRRSPSSPPRRPTRRPRG